MAIRYAFCCNSCGRLHTSGEAAESFHPGACRVCGAGVRFSPLGVKTLDPDNWEILADATEERLAELDLGPDDVEEHRQWTRGAAKAPASADVRASAADGPGTTDRGG